MYRFTIIPPAGLNPALIQTSIQIQARILAQTSKSEGRSANFDDCVTVVAAGLVGYGASLGGPIGAAIAAGAGIPAARLACRSVYP